jgi:hypothetical protein
MVTHGGANMLRRVPWLGLSLTAIAAVVITVAWVTRRGEMDSFPEPLIGAVGLLLTALLFVLALAQSRLHRTNDVVAEEARQLEDCLVTAFEDHPEAVTSADLWERAATMQEALFACVNTDWSRWERQLVLREARRPVGNFGSAGSFDRAFEILRIDRELDREADRGYPDRRLRKNLEGERARIIKDDEEAQEAADRAGMTAHGYRRLRGRIQVAQIWVQHLVFLARVFSGLMFALVVLGAVYAGWNLNEWPSPEVWATAVLIALAWVYTRVVLDDIRLESTAVDSTLRASSLLSLYSAEFMLGNYWKAVEERLEQPHQAEKAGHDPLSLSRVVASQLDKIAQRAPGLPWLASVRGRFLLIRAIDHASRIYGHQSGFEAHNDRMRRLLLEALRPATRLLSYAATRQDDPCAALAYARLLSLQAHVIQDELLVEPPDFLKGSDSRELRAQARDYDGRALTLMQDLPAFSSNVVFGLPHRGWIVDQSYLWPEHGAVRHELKRTLLIDKARPAPADVATT